MTPFVVIQSPRWNCRPKVSVACRDFGMPNTETLTGKSCITTMHEDAAKRPFSDE